jgi:hypothetical protein
LSTIKINSTGHTTQHWYERTGSRGKPAISVQFLTTVCRPCLVRERCTIAKAVPQVGFIPEPEFSALQAARQREQTDDFKETQIKRAGVEVTISQAMAVLGMRRTRYRGLDKSASPASDDCRGDEPDSSTGLA